MVNDTNIFRLDIDMSRILIINTPEDIIKFENKYRKNKDNFMSFIDWFEVSEDYRGIEIPNYIKLYNLCNDLPNWFSGWSVSSGCLFTTEVIKNFEEEKGRL